MVGVGMSPAYTALATNLLDSQVARQLTLGQKVTASDAVAMQVID